MDPDPFLIIYLSILKSDLFWIQTLLVLILLFFSAVISGAEVAFFSLQVKSLEDDDKEEISISKKRVISLLKKPKRLLATILVANNFINIAILDGVCYIPANGKKSQYQMIIKNKNENIMSAFLLKDFINEIYA